MRRNLSKLITLNSPAIKVTAINTGEAINTNLYGLYSLQYLCIGCMLTTNVCQQLGLSNGDIGIVRHNI